MAQKLKDRSSIAPLITQIMYLSAGDGSQDGKATLGELATFLEGFLQRISEKNQANGYAGLDGSGKVSSAQLPSYVDDVLEFVDVINFPAVGESGKIYIETTNGITYRWGGSMYVKIADFSNYYTKIEVDNISTLDRERANHSGTQPETTLTFSDNTTGNVTTSQHGFAPKLSGVSSQYLNGQGNYETPSGIVGTYKSVTFTSQTSVVINHGFQTFPVVQVISDTNTVIQPQSINHTSINETTITFATTTSGSALLTVGSPQSESVLVLTASATLSIQDKNIKCTTRGITVTLPSAIGQIGKKYNIDNASSGNIFVVGTSGQLIQNKAKQTLPINSSVTLYSDGTGYRIQ